MEPHWSASVSPGLKWRRRCYRYFIGRLMTEARPGKRDNPTLSLHTLHPKNRRSDPADFYVMQVETQKLAIHDFWNANPCGAKFIRESPGTKAFFDSLTEHRYSVENHIPEMVNFPQWNGSQVLEIGCGLGSDAEQFARNGALYSGIDLTETSIEMCRRRFAVQGLAGTFRVADAERLPFADECFDLVYSHGVIHHTPNTEAAVAEI